MKLQPMTNRHAKKCDVTWKRTPKNFFINTLGRKRIKDKKLRFKDVAFDIDMSNPDRVVITVNENGTGYTIYTDRGINYFRDTTKIIDEAKIDYNFTELTATKIVLERVK